MSSPVFTIPDVSRRERGTLVQRNVERRGKGGDVLGEEVWLVAGSNAHCTVEGEVHVPHSDDLFQESPT